MIGDDVTTAHSELVGLLARDGKITPASVVAEATSPDSPLHRYFVWDDTDAARRYRLLQAGMLIRRCRVRVEVEPERTVSVRAFLPIPREAKKGPSEYDDVYRVLRSEHRDVVFEQAMKDVSALRAKYQALTDFDAVLRSALKSGKKKAA